MAWKKPPAAILMAANPGTLNTKPVSHRNEANPFFYLGRDVERLESVHFHSLKPVSLGIL